MRRYRQSEGTDLARTGGSRSLLPQRLGCHVAGRGGILKRRFDIGFTDQQKADLAAFLSAL